MKIISVLQNIDRHPLNKQALFKALRRFFGRQLFSRVFSYPVASYSYNPFSRDLKLMTHWGTHNSIYIRDFDFVNNRIKTATKVWINNMDL